MGALTGSNCSTGRYHKAKRQRWRAGQHGAGPRQPAPCKPSVGCVCWPQHMCFMYPGPAPQPQQATVNHSMPTRCCVPTLQLPRASLVRVAAKSVRPVTRTRLKLKRSATAAEGPAAAPPPAVHRSLSTRTKSQFLMLEVARNTLASGLRRMCERNRHGHCDVHIRWQQI